MKNECNNPPTTADCYSQPLTTDTPPTTSSIRIVGNDMMMLRFGVVAIRRSTMAERSRGQLMMRVKCGFCPSCG